MKEFQDILSSIQQKKYHPVYLLEGEEPYYIDILLNHFENDILSPEERDFNYIEIYGRDVDVQEIISNARRYPMFSEKILVIIREAAQLKKIEELEGYVANPSPSTILVIDYRSKKVDKRSKLYKTLKSNAVIFTSEKIKDTEVPMWIQNLGKQKGVKIDSQEAEMLSVYLGNDLQKITNELNKVFINEPDIKELKVELIEKYIGISREYNLIDLPNIVFLQDRNRLSRMLNYFVAQPKSAPMAMVIGVFYSTINKLFLCHYTKQDFNADRQLGIWTTHRQIAGKYNIGQIHLSLALLEEYSHKSKGVGSTLGDTSLLKEFIAKLNLILNGEFR